VESQRSLYVQRVQRAGAISTGDSLADLLTGTLTTLTQSNTLEWAARGPVFSLYAQDTYKLSSRITVNMGLRWEPNLPSYDYFGRGSYFSKDAFLAGQKSSVFTNAPAGLSFYGDPGNTKSFQQSSWALFSPRLGLVFDPDGKGRQTIRISGAILRDTAELFYAERLTTNTPYGTSIDVPSPVGGFTNPYSGYPGGSPFPAAYAISKTIAFPANGVYVNMPNQTRPTYMAQWNVSYQRQITPNWLASVTYLGNKTTHIWVGEEINPALYGPGATTGNTNARRLLSRLNPVAGSSYASIVEADMGGNGNYNGMLLALQHRFAANYTVLANYTWSHCVSEVDFTGELAGSQYQEPGNRRANRGDCNFDYRHVANVSLIAESPGVGAGFTKRLTRGWQLAPIVQMRSGGPLNITTGSDTSLTGVGQDRPNLISDPSAAIPQNQTPAGWLNRAAFANNAPGTYGNVGRDAFRGPGLLSFDVALSRQFRLRERWALEGRAEAFNAINHANYNNPTTTLSSSNFGKITAAGDPRLLQFVMKVKF